MQANELPEPPALESNEISLILEKRTEGDEAKGFVPAYSFGVYLKEGRKRIGHINLRIGDTEHVMQFAGHIGFAINEEHQGNSYAAKACLALKNFAASFYESVIITCNPDNIASKRTLEKIGAEFIEEIQIPEDNHVRITHGETHKRRYRWKIR